MHLVLFDIDGTLIRGRMGSTALKNTFQDLFQVEAHTSEELHRVIFNGRSDNAILIDMARAFGIAPDTFERRKDEFLARYYENLETIVRTSKDKKVLPGVRPILEELQGHKSVAMGLLTGNMERGARIKLKDLGLSDYFPFGGFAEDGVDRKDIAQAAYRRGCRYLKIQVEARRVLVIGDTENDVIAGKAHGFRVAGVATGGVPCETLTARGADFCFETLEDGFLDTLRLWIQE